MKTCKKLVSVLMAVVMVAGCLLVSMPTKAAASAESLINDLILYYRDYQDAAETDILRTLDDLKAVDEEKYEEWKQIMEYWDYVNTDMVVNIDTTEVTDLPTDDSVCIVILGYALNSDGTMKEELIGRLETGLALANQYPEAYVAVTGGGTAANNSSVTEGGLMGEWLLENGLDADRLIIENKAPNTVGNALNTYNILRKDYPTVDSICLVTSDYHVPRGCLLFYSKCLIAAYEADDQFINVISNAGYVTGREGYETISLQATGVADVAGLSLSGSVKLSTLSYLTIEMQEAYETGEDLNLTVTASYNTGYSKDVTDKVEISGFDPALDATQQITVSYTENDLTISGVFCLADMSKELIATDHVAELINDAEAIDASLYTDKSVEKLNSAVAEAKALLESGDYAAQEVENAYQNLLDAYNRLVKILNAALQKNVTASCNQAEAAKIVNGSTSDYWSSKDSNGDVAIEDSYFIIDLDGEYELDRIHVTPYNGNNRYYHYDVQVSVDGENWATVAEHRSTEPCTSAGNVHEMEAATYARYVKVVGVDVYRPDKEIINFHVKEVAVYGAESDNLALGKRAISSGTDLSASSSSGSSERTAVDGDRATYWDGGKYSARPWLTVDLEDVYKLSDVNVINYWKNSDRYYQYEVHTSIDGENYTLLGEKTNSAVAGMFGETYECTEDVFARYVKVVGTYNSKNSAFHLNELRVHGELAEESEYLEYQYNEAKNGVAELIAECEELYKKADYTEATWSVYEAALDQAKAVLANPESATNDFYAASNALRAAVQQLAIYVPEKPEGVYRLASTNIYSKGNPEIDKLLAQFYDRYEIDYAGLQEVDRNTTRNPFDIMEELTTDTRFVDFAYNKNMDYQGGEYGIGIVSTTEIKESGGGLYELLGSEEPRGWVRTVLEIDGKEVAFYDTHLSTEDEACISNMEEIIALMDADPLEYKILTADFNCNREWMYPFYENYNMANGKDGLWYATSGDDYTDIASSEAYGLDNIITSRNIDVLDFKVIDSEDLSDHNFIYIDFKLLDEEVPSKEYLNIEVEDAKKLEEADYTEASYAVLADALAAAEALTDTATQEEINAVIADIQDAVEALVRIHPMISEGKPVTTNGKISEGKTGDINDGYMLSFLKTDYNSDIIMDLEGLYDIDEIQVFDFGKAPRTHHYTLYTSVDGVEYEYFAEKNTDEIASIKTGQVFEKEDCVARYVKIVMTYNSTSTDHVYLSELEVYGSPAESLEIVKAALGDLIASYRQLNSADYLSSSYAAFMAEVEKAQSVYDNADASKEEIQMAYDALTEAFESLEPAADKAELLDLIADCKAMDLGKYSERTVANLQAKLAEAQAVCEDGDVSQAVVDVACEKLELAVSLLAAPVDAAYKMKMEAAENSVVVTLDGIYNLNEIVVVTDYDDSIYYNYEVYVSEDNENWTKVAEQTGDEVATEEGYVHEVDDSLAVKYIKVESTEALNVEEINAYGEEMNNIALGKPIITSGSTTSNVDLYLNDGSRSNYWEAGKWASQPWAIIDLEGLYKLDSINVITYWKGNDRYYQYDLYTSTDGENFTLYAERDNKDYTTVYGDTFEAEGDVYATHIKIVGTYNSKNSVFHLNELRAYGELQQGVPEIPETEVCRIFTDVEHGAWYEDSVQYVYEAGLMFGNEGAFSPRDNATRAMVAAILYRMEGSPVVTDYTKYHQFSDVAEVSEHVWYTDAIAWALNAGVATGDDENMLYNPNAAVTREQLATFLYRYAGYKGADVAVEDSYDEIFGDTYVNDWAKAGFAWAVESGIITGAETTDADGNIYVDLLPQDGATRAQMATMLTRYFANMPK